MAAASSSGPDRVPRPVRASAAVIPRMTFGMHNKKSFEIVAAGHPEYYFWVKRQPGPTKMLKEFLDWVEMNHDVDFHHEALRHKQTLLVVSQEVPQEYKPSSEK